MAKYSLSDAQLEAITTALLAQTDRAWILPKELIRPAGHPSDYQPGGDAGRLMAELRCQSCHRPGEVAPMSLMSYSDARPWAKAIKAAVVSQKMPPWFADPKYGHFSNDRRSSRSEKLIPDLEIPDNAPNFSNEFLSGGWRWNIQWNDDFVLCCDWTLHTGTMHGDL